MSGLGAAQIDLRNRSSSGSSGNQLGICQSLTPGKWRLTPPSLVVGRSFGPKFDCIYLVHV